MKRQENRAVLAWRGAASAGLVSSADRAYMKAPVPRPTLRLVDKVSRSCGHTPGKVAGQRATVKAEMNGFTPGLDLRPLSRWMGGQGGQSLKVLGRSLSFWGLSSPKIEMGGKALKWLSRLDYPLAKTGETVNGGAESAVHLDR